MQHSKLHFILIQPTTSPKDTHEPQVCQERLDTQARGQKYRLHGERRREQQYERLSARK